MQNRKSLTSGSQPLSSLANRVLAAWATTFTLELRLLEGKGKFLLGGLLNVAALATFLGMFCYELTTYSTTTYISSTYKEYYHSSYERSTTECSTVPVSISSTLYVDENGAWSTDSSKYNSFKMLKQVTFESFEGDESDFNQAIADLNSCIDDINVYTSNSSFQSSLIYLGFTECQAANETLTLSFPMGWDFIYDFSQYSVESNLVLPNDYSWNHALRTQNKNSSFSGKVSLQVDKLLNLQITCAANYTKFTPMPAQDYCGLLYTQQYNNSKVQTEEKEVNIQLDLDSVARCMAINKHVVDANFTDDLLVTSWGTDHGSTDTWSFYYAYLQGADNPTLMYIMPTWGYCVLVYKDEVQDIAMYPILEYTEETCYSTFGPVSESCSMFDETGCPSEFAVDIVLWMYNADISQNYGAIRMSAKGARQVVNSNLYYFKENANLSCQPLLAHLPNSSQADVPVDLIESYYKCTTRAAESWSGALADAYANAQVAIVCAALFVSMVLLRFFGGRLGQTLDYDDEAVEVAQLELALARVEEKKQLNIPLTSASLRGLTQDSEEGGGKAPMSSLLGGQSGAGPADKGLDVAALLAEMAELRAEVAQVAELRAEVEALKQKQNQRGGGFSNWLRPKKAAGAQVVGESPPVAPQARPPLTPPAGSLGAAGAQPPLSPDATAFAAPS